MAGVTNISATAENKIARFLQSIKKRIIFALVKRLTHIYQPAFRTSTNIIYPTLLIRKDIYARTLN